MVALTPFAAICWLFGPCEVLIPLLMYPAATLNLGAVALVAGVFSTVTIATMLGLVYLSIAGLRVVSTERFARYAHALAGATVFLCGAAIQFGL